MEQFSNITILSQNDVHVSHSKIFERIIIFMDNETKDKYRCVQQIIHTKKVPRREIKPFGNAVGMDPFALTSFGEEVFIVKPGEEEVKTSQFKKDDLEVKCRNCNGDHMTYMCALPRKEEVRKVVTDGSYVPPSMKSDYTDQIVTVKISNLPTDIDVGYLKELFIGCGRIDRANVPRDRKTGDGRGFAFIDFCNRDGAEKAVVTMNKFRIEYYVITVEIAEGRDGKKVNTKIASKNKVKFEKEMYEAKKRAIEKPPEVAAYRPPARQEPVREERVERDYQPRGFTRGSNVVKGVSYSERAAATPAPESGGFRRRSDAVTSRPPVQESGGFRRRSDAVVPREETGYQPPKSTFGGFNSRGKGKISSNPDPPVKRGGGFGNRGTHL